MKKKNRVASFALIVLTAMAGFTCKQNIGLGGRINILPPSGEITYPDSGETPIRGSFVLKGTARDDDGIKSISVVFENIDTKEKTKVYDAERFSEGDVSVSWTINVNNESTGTEAGHDLVKVYPIPDGEYTAILSVTDKGGKTTTFTKNYKIDNTPPVFIVSRPSAVAGKDEIPPAVDGYGAVFSVVGQAGEKNAVEKLHVHVPGTSPIDMTNMFVGNNINAEVAAFPNSSYTALYALQGADKTKPIKGQLYLYDNAREYKGEGASGEGNKAEWFYQRNSIYTDVIAKGYTSEVISDYFAGKKGSDKNDHDKKIKALREDTAALAKLKENMVKMTEKRSIFKVDPSISPGFKVIGVKHLSGTPTPANVSQASSMLFKAGNKTTFSVELIPNKDNIPLVEGSNLAAYKKSKIKIVLHKWNGTRFDSDHPILLVDFEALTDTSLIKMEGDNLRVKCEFPSDQGEGIYAVNVDGTDTIKEDAHKFVAYDDSNTANGMYVINFLAVGIGPRIRPVRPQGFKNANFAIEADVSGIDTGGRVYCKIDAVVPAVPDSSTVELTKLPVAEDPSGLRYKATVNIDGLSNGEHKIYFLIKNGSGSSDTDDTVFTVDKAAPQVEILSPDLSKNQSGDFTMRGSVIDTPSGVKSIKYIVGKQNATDITVKPATTASGWKSLSLSADSWAIPFTDAENNNITQKAKAETIGKKVGGLAPGVELYDIPIFFLVEDKAGESTQKGNIDVITKVIRVDPNGDIPGVTVLSPEADKVLGGTIRISGTVSVPNPAAGQVGSVWIQITDKTKTGHPNEPDFSQSALFGGNEWCLPASEGKQLTSYTMGNPYWSVEINGSKEFEPSSGTQRVIWFRLRGKNTRTTPVAGQWTAPIKIIVDKAAPTITGMKIATESKIGTAIPSSPIDPENQTYVSNMWIKGDALYLCADLAHDAGIEKIDISGTYLGSPVSLTGNSQITGYQLHNKHCFEQVGNNYKMRIPLKTTTNPGNNNGFTVNVTIKAKKQGEVEGLTASTSFSFKYDNSKPTAVFGTKIHSSGTVQVNGTSFTDPALIGKTNINSTMKVFTSGQDIKITAFDKTIGKVTLASAPANPTKGYLLYSPIEYLRPDGSGKVGVFGAAYDVGAGVEKVKVNYNGATSTEITLELPSGVQTDVGNGDVNFVTWKGELNVNSFADGTGKIVITPIDRANNVHDPIEVSVKLKKNSLMISAVELGTDMNRNGIVANVGSTVVETKTLVLTYDADKQPNGIDSEKYDWYGKADAGTFRLKNNKSQIKIVTTGGTNPKKYTLKCVTNGQDVHGLAALPSDGVITLNAADFTKIGQSDDLATSNPKKRKLLLTVWDSAHGLTAGTNTWKAELTFEVIVDTVDRVPPTNEIDPFKWASETENSLYDNKRDNGHIEIGTDLPSTFNQTNGLMDKDDKVSGKISITGTAHDDQVITEIWAKIDGFTFTGGATGTGADAGYTKVATFTAGSFSDAGNFNTHGWHFSIVSNAFSVENGHTVKWKLDWDTAKITGGVGTDKTITIRVKDTDQTNTVAKNRRVDVVPFITSIANTAGEGLSNSVIRGSDGTYSMNCSATEKMTVKGFNLKPASGKPTVTIGGGAVADTKVSVVNNDITIVKDASSGALVVKVGSVESINNKVDITKPYNQEKDITNPSSNLWNVKRELVFWENKQVCTSKPSQTFYYPSMVMDGEQPIFAYCDNNDGYTYRTTGDNASDQRGGRWFARNAVLAKTSDNKYMILSNEDNFDSNKYSGYLYLNSKDINGGARIGQNYSSPTSFIELCSASYGNANWKTPSLNRFKYPHLIVEGNQVSAQIYISYYDSKEKEIRFFAFKKTGEDTSNIGIEADSLSSAPRGLANGTLVVSGTAGGKSSEHTAMAKVGTGIYIAYQDASSGTLKLAYSTAPLITGMTYNNGLANTAAVWSTLEVDSSPLTGQHVSMVASGTKLYIAYHDAARAMLKLAVVDTSGTVTVKSKVIVDAYQSVGYKTGIMVLNGLPYISYYNSAQTGTRNSIKIAYPKDTASIELAGAETSGAFTGNWISMYVPSISVPNVGIPEFNRVMIDNYSSNTKPVLAWLGDPFIEYTKMK